MPNHFFSQNGLTACCTDTSITLFWDKPAAAGAVETYTVLLDDAAAAHTQKTTVHWRICVRKRPIRCSFSGGAAALGN